MDTASAVVFGATSVAVAAAIFARDKQRRGQGDATPPPAPRPKPIVRPCGPTTPVRMQPKLAAPRKALESAHRRVRDPVNPVWRDWRGYAGRTTTASPDTRTASTGACCLPYVVLLVDPATVDVAAVCTALDAVLDRRLGDVSCVRFTCDAATDAGSRLAAAAAATATTPATRASSPGDVTVVVGRDPSAPLASRTLSPSHIAQLRSTPDARQDLTLWLGQALAVEAMTIVVGDPDTSVMAASLQKDVDIALVAHGCADPEVRAQVMTQLLPPGTGTAVFHVGDETVHQALPPGVAAQVKSGTLDLQQAWVRVQLLLEPSVSQVTAAVELVPPRCLHTVVLLGHGNMQRGLFLRQHNTDDSDAEDDDDIDDHVDGGDAAIVGEYLHPDHLARALRVDDARTEAGARPTVIAMTCDSKLWTTHAALATVADTVGIELQVAFPADAAEAWEGIGATVIPRTVASAHGAGTRVSRELAALVREALRPQIQALASSSHNEFGLLRRALVRSADVVPVSARQDNFFLRPWGDDGTCIRVIAWPAGHGDCYSIAVRSHDAGEESMWIVVDGGYTTRKHPTFEHGVWPHLLALPRATQYPGVDMTLLTHVDADHVTGLRNWAKYYDMAPADDGSAASMGVVVANIPHTDVTKAWRAGVNAAARSIGQLRDMTTHFINSVFVRAARDSGAHTVPPLIARPYRGPTLSVDDDEEATVRFRNEAWWGDLFGLSVEAVHPTAEHVRKYYDDNVQPSSKDLLLPLKKRPKAREHHNKAVTRANLFGAVFLITVTPPDGGPPRRCLFCGDADGTDIADGVEASGHTVTVSNPLDLITLPHHGSQNNVTASFFARLPARRYVASSSGHKFGHPDLAVLEMLADHLVARARTGRRGVIAEVVFTHADAAREAKRRGDDPLPRQAQFRRMLQDRGVPDERVVFRATMQALGDSTEDFVKQGTIAM